MTPGPLQIALVIILVLLLFGAGRVPLVMENVAKGIRSFKKGLRDEGESDTNTASPKKVQKPVKDLSSADDGGDE